MFARVTMTEGSPDKIEQGIDSYKSRVLPAVQGVDGYKGSLLLVNHESGKAIGISLWETEDARRRAAQAVDAARTATIETMGGTVPPVEEYEVAVSNL